MSPKVATYDLQPEMSAFELADALVPELEKEAVDFVCLNFANGDMVRAIGSAITRREENSLIPGLITHFFFGVVFTALYVFLLSMVPEAAIEGPDRTLRLVVLGAMMGLVRALLFPSDLSSLSRNITQSSAFARRASMSP